MKKRIPHLAALTLLLSACEMFSFDESKFTIHHHVVNDCAMNFTLLSDQVHFVVAPGDTCFVGTFVDFDMLGHLEEVLGDQSVCIRFDDNKQLIYSAKNKQAIEQTPNHIYNISNWPSRWSENDDRTLDKFFTITEEDYAAAR